MTQYGVDTQYSFISKGIDKITLGIETRFLNYHQSPDSLRGIIDVVNWGDWSELNIQWEYGGISHIDNNYPWWSVLSVLQCGISSDLFTPDLSSRLDNCLSRIHARYYSPLSFITLFFDTGVFKLDEYELYFDFHGYNPFVFKEGCFKKYENSIYTMDSKRKMRRNGEHKGFGRSLLCFYNRGLKINSREVLNRLEFRICDDRARAMLTPRDIYISVYDFINNHAHQISHTLKRYLKEDSIEFDMEYIQNNAPELSRLLGIVDKQGGYISTY
jgi:hypothetical protein